MTKDESYGIFKMSMENLTGKNCKMCKSWIENITIQPHINLFKEGFDINNLLEESEKDFPKPHLHVFYSCPSCSFKEVICTIQLLTNADVSKLIKKDVIVNPSRTLHYWTKKAEKEFDNNKTL